MSNHDPYSDPSEPSVFKQPKFTRIEGADKSSAVRAIFDSGKIPTLA